MLAESLNLWTVTNVTLWDWIAFKGNTVGQLLADFYVKARSPTLAHEWNPS